VKPQRLGGKREIRATLGATSFRSDQVTPVWRPVPEIQATALLIYKAALEGWKPLYSFGCYARTSALGCCGSCSCDGLETPFHCITRVKESCVRTPLAFRPEDSRRRRRTCPEEGTYGVASVIEITYLIFVDRDTHHTRACDSALQPALSPHYRRPPRCRHNLHTRTEEWILSTALCLQL
jgi:hypothetical protein